MGKILKAGRVVLLTSGRHAGKKGLVVRSYDDGTKARRYAHTLVVGLARNPRAVTRRMSKKRFTRRTAIKPFVKFVNHNHVMPTRYMVTDFELKDLKDESVVAGEKRQETIKVLSKTLSDKYRNLPDAKTNEKANHLRFFYKKLRF